MNLMLALLTNLTLATLLVTIAFWLPQMNAYSGIKFANTFKN